MHLDHAVASAVANATAVVASAAPSVRTGGSAVGSGVATPAERQPTHTDEPRARAAGSVKAAGSVALAAPPHAQTPQEQAVPEAVHEAVHEVVLEVVPEVVPEVVLEAPAPVVADAAAAVGAAAVVVGAAAAAAAATHAEVPLGGTVDADSDSVQVLPSIAIHEEP